MRPIFCTILLSFFLHSFAFADDLNKPKGLTSKDEVKILKVVAKGYAQGKQDEFRQKGAGCNTQIGVTNIQRGAVAPREVNTVIKGDVISVCK